MDLGIGDPLGGDVGLTIAATDTREAPGGQSPDVGWAPALLHAGTELLATHLNLDGLPSDAAVATHSIPGGPVWLGSPTRRARCSPARRGRPGAGHAGLTWAASAFALRAATNPHRPIEAIGHGRAGVLPSIRLVELTLRAPVGRVSNFLRELGTSLLGIVRASHPLPKPVCGTLDHFKRWSIEERYPVSTLGD